MPLKNGKTTASVQTILTGSVIPSGTIAPFGGGTVPAGWLLCDGATVSRATYSALFEVVGTLHGQGDGSTTFHLPDYRGRFLRGADNMGTGAAGRDPNAGARTAANTGGATGAGVGSVQSDAMQQITGNFHTIAATGGTANSTAAGAFAKNSAGTGAVATSGSAAINNSFDSANSPSARTSTESRPQNANVEYIIKV
jgi:microcystin-dependent protein